MDAVQIRRDPPQIGRVLWGRCGGYWRRGRQRERAARQVVAAARPMPTKARRLKSGILVLLCRSSTVLDLTLFRAAAAPCVAREMAPAPARINCGQSPPRANTSRLPTWLAVLTMPSVSIRSIMRAARL